MAVETVKQRRARLQAELDKLNKLEKPTLKQTKRATSLIKQITALDEKIFKGRRKQEQLKGTLAEAKKATKEKVIKSAGPVRPAVKVDVDDTTKKSEASKRVEKSIEPAPPSRVRKDAPTIEAGVAGEKRRRVRKGFGELERGTEAGRRKAAREKTAKTEREGFGELEKGAEAGRRRFELREKKYGSPKDYQIAYDSPNRPGKDSIGVRSDDPALTKAKAQKAVNTSLKALDKKQDTGGRFGTAAGKRAIKSFFEDAFGIKDISVDYTFPGDKGYGSPQGGKKKGGKVKSKRSSTKKYSMNRGGVASVRKPTRA